MTRALAFALVAALLCLAPGCGEKSESWKKVEEGAGNTWGAVKTWSVERRDKASAFFKKSMADLEPKLKAAREKAAKAGGAASKALDEKAQTAAKALEALKGATAENWDKARDVFAAAYEDLKDYVKTLDD
jgi:hypothetical protein